MVKSTLPTPEMCVASQTLSASLWEYSYNKLNGNQFINLILQRGALKLETYMPILVPVVDRILLHFHQRVKLSSVVTIPRII